MSLNVALIHHIIHGRYSQWHCGWHIYFGLAGNSKHNDLQETELVAPDTRDRRRISYVAQSCDGSQWSVDA